MGPVGEDSAAGRQSTNDPDARRKGGRPSIVSPRRCSLLELQAGMERWESEVSQFEENSKNKMNDEIKPAGLEALVPEELEEHLILNSIRLPNFRGCSSRSRDVRGGEVRFENS